MRRILDALRRDGRWVLLLVLVAWIFWSWPIASGERTFVLRDVFTTHLPLKVFGAEQLRAGRIPAFNPNWAIGQPFRGNPNALPFYPGNLLYLVLPFWSAFGLHYVGHWLLAFFGMRRLGRELGQSAEGALVAGIAYAGSGYLLTCLTFMNLLTVAAWAPWVLAGLARGGRRGTALAGVACGLMLVGGEPISAGLVVPAMALVAIERHGLRRGLASAALAGLTGLALAAPQIVASLRVLPFTYRATHGLPAGQVIANSLHPARLLELVWPLPWGWPSDLGRFGFWAPSVTPATPYIYSLHFGLIAFGLALLAMRSRRAWAALASAALFGAWALGLDGDVTARLTLGVFRFPQKLLLVFLLSAAVLAGFGLDRVRSVARPARPWLVAAGGFAGLAALLALRRDAWTSWMALHLAPRHDALVARTQAGHWIVLALVAAMLALGAAWAARRRSAAGLAFVQFLAVLQMAPLWVTDGAAAYRGESTFARAVVPPRSVAYVPATFPPWEPGPYFRASESRPELRLREMRDHLPPDFGVLDRTEQVLAPDLDGITSPLTVLVVDGLRAADWSPRVRWLRRLGAGWIVRAAESPGPELPVVATGAEGTSTVTLQRVPDPAVRLEWPRRVLSAKSPIEAWIAVARQRGGEEATVVSRAVTQTEGRLTPIEEGPDGVVFDVESTGGLAVWRRAYWPVFRARLEDGSPLRTQPVDVALLGIEIPAGSHRVTVDVASWPESLAGALAVLVAIVAGGLAWRRT